MNYLILSIVTASSLYAIFKMFSRFGINNLHAITINYFTAFTLGFLLSPLKITLKELPALPWFYYAMGLGVLFISVFNVMAYTSQKNGMAVASTASKMSVVIPVLAGILLYGESKGILKIVGVLLAIYAVYLTASKNEGVQNKAKGLLFPILLFFGSGAIDTLLKYVENQFVSSESVALFSACIFLFAGIFGLISWWITRQMRIDFKSIAGGIVLGIPNYFSVYFLIKTLASEGIESSTAFTIINVAVVALSTLIGLMVFKEKLSLKNRLGVLLAIISIFIVAYF